ncbi:Meiotically up-regulated protein [Lasiodiplodia theobromae]|uniref:Meiotically up-regulated protein n=1 Tax=Lasiodiplodia theobromae TaxID=45133 RepID=UPI0015C32AD0|nr:Meiotically up-regulated protein [Lasiodiplodia theobromae]KAF4536444.1 Meiotically up-regulated protein [Lasiodiplodia theobromae]
MQDEEHLPGLFKVGILQDVRRRRRDILAQCGLWDLYFISQVEVACPHRVEKLVHLTLSYFTDKMPYIHDKPGHAEISPGKIYPGRTEHAKTGNQKNSNETTTVYHREWFWCNLEVVKDVVGFWVRWVDRVLDVQNMERNRMDDIFAETWETFKRRIEMSPLPKRGRRRRKTLA